MPVDESDSDRPRTALAALKALPGFVAFFAVFAPCYLAAAAVQAAINGWRAGRADVRPMGVSANDPGGN